MARDNSLSEEEFIAQCLKDFPDILDSEYYDPEYFSVLSACDTYYLAGFADSISGDTGAPTGHFYRVHRWIVVTDSQGFHDLHTFDNEDEAAEAFDTLDEEYSGWWDDNDV